VAYVNYHILRGNVEAPSTASFFLLLKYLGSRRIILLSIAAVAISVSLLIVVASIFTGFIAALERSAVEMIGDVVMEAPDGVQFAQYPAFLGQLEQSSAVEAATATLSTEGLLHVGKGNVRPVTLWGIEADRRTRVTGFKRYLLRQGQMPGEPSFAVPETPDTMGGFVGIGVVADPDEQSDEYDRPAILKEMVGQLVSATTGTVDTTAGADRIPRKRSIAFRVADIVVTGVHDFDSTFVYLPIETLQKELYPDRTDAVATRISIKLKPGVAPEAAVAQIRGLWRAFATETLGWSPYLAAATPIETARQMQSRYVGAIRQQMGILLLIFGVISSSVVVLMFCIFYMMVRLKQKDIAVVKSCGAADSSVIGLFLSFGACVGVAGAALGVALGYVITRNINAVEQGIRILFGLKLWKSSVYVFDKIPNQVAWGSALPIVSCAIVAAILGALIPAVVAARMKPVEVLRYE
jgi:ABC-type lipoprotein release transport system permease subunit